MSNRLPNQIRMRADQTDFFLLARLRDSLAKTRQQIVAGREGPRLRGARGDPGRVLENRSDPQGKLLAIHRIHLSQL